MATAFAGKTSRIGSSPEPIGTFRAGRGWRSVIAAIALPMLAIAFAPKRALALPTCPGSFHISKCCKITVPGNYDALSDFATSIASGACIDISVADVNLSTGHTITGPGTGTPTIGVLVEAAAVRVAVSGSVFHGFGTGARIDATGSVLALLDAGQNGTGVVLNGPGAVLIRVSASNNARNGILVNSTATGPEMEVVLAKSNGKSGIKLNQVSAGFLDSVNSSNNGQSGIWLNGTTGTVVSNFLVDSNGVTGVYLGCHAAGPTDLVPCSVGSTPTRDNIVLAVDTGTPSATNSNWGVAIDAGSGGNRVSGVLAVPSFLFDLFDGNRNCGTNVWSSNTFISSNRSCIQ